MLKLKPAPALAALALAAAFTAGPAQAAGTVEVNFVEPQKFADIGFNAVDRERVLQALGEFLKGLAARLPDGQTLKMEITDINLAGELQPTRHGDLRVMRGRADWPQIWLRYTLLSGTQTLKSGEAHVYDMAYMEGQRTPESDSQYGFEKRMLRRWFEQNFGAH